MLFGWGVANSSDFQGHVVGEVLFWRGATKQLQHEPDSLVWDVRWFLCWVVFCVGCGA